MTSVFGPLAMPLVRALVTLLSSKTVEGALDVLKRLSNTPGLKLRHARHARECCICKAHLDFVAYSVCSHSWACPL